MQFSKEFQVLLFHYDGKVSEWDEYEWSRTAIHISTRKQAKWYVLSVALCHTFCMFASFNLHGFLCLVCH